MAALATYKDLCLDAVDAHAEGAFWAAQLGLEHHPHEDGGGCLKDASGSAVVWVNRVPEPKTAKNRVHLDVNAESLDAALAGGARIVDDSQRWVVMTDPDGQEFCVFVREGEVRERLYELVWDAAPDGVVAIATWWGNVLGVEPSIDATGAGPPEVASLDRVPNAPFDYIVFSGVPEPKTVKNRVHIDVTTDDVDRLVDRGARLLRRKGDDGLGWHVLTDPGGNEFCAFTPD